MRLRNPYAKMPDGRAAPEWRGAWGNAAADWQDNPGVAAQLGGRPRDGSFWMDVQDFYRGFNKVHVCRLAPAPTWDVQRVAGEWTTETAGGELNALPGSRWRTNPQYRLRVGRDTSAVIAVAQPDAQLDKNEASDSYPHEVGFFLFHQDAGTAAGPPRRKLVVEPEMVAACPRLACTRQVGQEVYLQAGVEYTVMPCTKEAYVTLAYTLTVATAAGAGAELFELPAEPSLSLRGEWAVRSDTAGGCPNEPETWTLNPQFLLTVAAPMTLTGVLCLELDAARAADVQRQQAQIAADAANVRATGVDEQQAAAIEQQALALAPAIGWVLMRCDTAEMGGLIRGSYDHAQAQQVGNSQFSHGTQEVVAEVALDVGTYTLIPSTFEARHEAPFALTLYHSAPNALQVTPLVGGQAVSGDAGRPGAPRPQGPTGPPPSGSGKNHMAPPAAKYDVAEVRSQQAASRRAAGGGQSETDDDGKMGYAERMEMEELERLGKWKENVPMMTIEGQPLSDTCKKWAKDLTDAALAQCAATGRKFEDGGFPDLPLDWNKTGFPAMAGSAQSDAQPQVYGNGAGEPVPGMPAVTHWRRPEEMGMPTAPVLFKNDWEVEGIIQSPHLDNRWFISALNIVAGNREQPDRMFMCDCQYKDKGFFVIKFYRDDPLSDDDWAVVLVDDRIPCDASGLAAFCRNKDPSVYWAMIVEKAYAKLSGSYEAMQGGTVVQGLEDLTGGVGYKFDWEKGEKGEKEWVPPKGETPERLWDEIMEKMKTEHVVGCANNTKGQPKPKTEKKGVLLNRAYAVVTGGEFEQNKLLKLRVPLDEHGRAQESNPNASANANPNSNPNPNPNPHPKQARAGVERRVVGRLVQVELSHEADALVRGQGGRRLLLDRVRRLLQALQQAVHGAHAR